jgi:hypothetical protein
VFKTEKDLVESSLPLVQSFFSTQDEVIIVQEPKGLFGIPDVLLYNGDIVAIEFKLKDWKRALQQAFRYRSFSYESYVFLDSDYIGSAVKNLDQFERFNIGLCGVTEEGIESYHKPNRKNPFSSDMINRAYELFDIKCESEELV